MKTRLLCLIVIAAAACVAACGEGRSKPPCGYAHGDPPFCIDPPPGYKQTHSPPGMIFFNGSRQNGDITVMIETTTLEGITFADWVASRTSKHEPTPLADGNGVMVVREDRLGTSRITFLEAYLDAAPGKVVVCRANGTTGKAEWPAVTAACKSLRRP